MHNYNEFGSFYRLPILPSLVGRSVRTCSPHHFFSSHSQKYGWRFRTLRALSAIPYTGWISSRPVAKDAAPPRATRGPRASALGRNGRLAALAYSSLLCQFCSTEKESLSSTVQPQRSRRCLADASRLLYQRACTDRHEAQHLHV